MLTSHALAFQVENVLDISPDLAKSQFDVILDKGTYDAIGLSPDQAEPNQKRYLEVLGSLMSPSGLFILSSVNYTAPKLTSDLAQAGFDLRDEIPSKSFTFGGVKGSNVTSLVFIRKGS